MEPIITLAGVTRHPPTARNPIVNHLSLALYPGEILVLLGPSGSGKTTTLRLIAGLEIPDHGEITIRGVSAYKNGHTAPPEARRVGMVFQDYALFPHMTVTDNIRFALHAYPKHEQLARITEALRLVGLTALGDRFPHQLSGGQQQRVAIARALAPEPPVILLDEPFSNLDSQSRDHVRSELRTILRNANTSAIIVTHDQQEALAIADRIALLHEGVLHQIGTPEMLFTQPNTRFAAAFMGQADFLPVVHTDTILSSELGTLQIHTPTNAHPSTQVSVLLRYDDIEFQPATDGNAIIRERTYEGAYYHYRLQLANGQFISGKKNHESVFPVGCQVRVRYRATHPLVCFVGEQAWGNATPLPLTTVM
ncbi:MAG: ABC transporter ATP-binding protein [Chloroflexi bacterium]|nr:MAG: ABC transporter ATP-binding protein [Chloroflexota bacterium]